jgi:hypothetical protein
VCAPGTPATLAGPFVLFTHPDETDASGVLQQGRAHIVTTVPTGTGWGVFWLRDKTNDLWDILATSTLYYAHVDVNGVVTTAPRPLLDIHRHDREPLYLVAWQRDHFGLLINELTTTDVNNKITYQYYYDLTRDGQLSARVGPIRTDLGSSGGIGDMIPYLSGFMVGIEVVCQGSHQCSYAFTLGDHGTPKGWDQNVVEFDGTHSHWPAFANDGSGVVVVSSKDANSSRGGMVSQYITRNGTSITSSMPVIPNHGFLLDNNPRVAWNGARFGLLWREVEGLISPLDQNTRLRFATFLRNQVSSTLLTDRFVEPAYVPAQDLERSGNWTTSLSVVADGWVAGYARGRSAGAPEAVIEHLLATGESLQMWVPYTLDDYAFHTSALVHGSDDVVGIAASRRNGSQVDVTFATLTLPCGP